VGILLSLVVTSSLLYGNRSYGTMSLHLASA
jgi:hypothetical protein